MAIPDPLVAVRTYLLADAGVSAIASTRVFAAELPSTEASNMPRAAVVVTAAGGGQASLGARSHVPVGSIRMDVRCYGETPAAASALHYAVLSALKAIGRTFVDATLLHSCVVEGGPFNLREPDVDWPLVLSTYSLLAAEVAAPA